MKKKILAGAMAAVMLCGTLTGCARYIFGAESLD